MKMRVVEIASNLMIKNDAIARGLRQRFAENGTLVVNLLSSPGSGKTTLLEETMRRLKDRYAVAALVGDQATANDAARLARTGVPVHQITTGAECRLDAEMISQAIAALGLARFDVIFIENVGNLICPAEYDLGEDLRAVLLSVTEGEDKPLKYPLAFHSSHVALITKTDLADATGFDRDAAVASIRQVNPDIAILDVSTRNSIGIEAWLATIETRIHAKNTKAAATAH